MTLVVGTALACAGPAAPVAHADSGSTSVLQVDRSSSTCSDTGAGTAEQPFCTIQAAVDVAGPGQTVKIALGTYPAFTVRNSGTQDAPITIQGPGGPFIGMAVDVNGDADTPAITVTGAQHVRIAGMGTTTSCPYDATSCTEVIQISDAADVTLDDIEAHYFPASESVGNAGAVRISGGSRSVSVERSDIDGERGACGICVEAGVTDVDVASDGIGADGGALSVSGATDVNVVGDTLDSEDAPVLSMTSASSGVIENDSLQGTSAANTPTLLSVSADSASAVHEDYNALASATDAPEYDWGGTDYTSSADLTAATGQGAHDIDKVSSFSVEGSPTIDSGDAEAPGELSTDLFGHPRVDDPLDADSGTGYVDRGATELQDPIGAPSLNPADASGIAPFTLSVGPGPESTWNEPLSVSVDFGDGSPAVSAAAGAAATHTYTVPGVYTETTTTTDTGGSTRVTTSKVTVGTSTPLHLSLTAHSNTDGGTVATGDAWFSSSSTPYSWEIASRTIDFGDGSSPADMSVTPDHEYSHIGVFTATMTVTDIFGRSTTSTAKMIVGDEMVTFPDVSGEREYDSRQVGHSVPAHGTVRVVCDDLTADPQHDVDAYVLDVTVMQPQAGGYVTAYPSRTTRPTASLVNFTRGQTISNHAVVATGKDGCIDVYNGSTKPIGLIVDAFSSENHNWGAYTYQPLTPKRVLDTRTTGHPVAGGGGDVRFQIAGRYGVPSDAKAVLLHVTEADARSSGYLQAYGEGVTRTQSSNLNWAVHQVASNLALVSLEDGKVVLRNGGTASADFVADLVGYYSQFEGSTVYLPVRPTRLLDTRSGLGAPARQLRAHQTLRLRVAGGAGTPAHGAAAAALTITVTGSSASGYLTAYPDGTARPGTSDVNWTAGRTVAGSSHVTLGADGYVDIYNGGSAPVSVIADLSGVDYLYSAPAS